MHRATIHTIDIRYSTVTYFILLHGYVNLSNVSIVCTGFTKSLTPPLCSIAAINVDQYIRVCVKAPVTTITPVCFIAYMILPLAQLYVMLHMPLSRCANISYITNIITSIVKKY